MTDISAFFYHAAQKVQMPHNEAYGSFCTDMMYLCDVLRKAEGYIRNDMHLCADQWLNDADAMFPSFGTEAALWADRLTWR
jgi:hypothetical protein